MIITAREDSMLMWVLSVLTGIFEDYLMEMVCVCGRLSLYGWLRGLGVHMIKGGLPCGGKNHGQS